MKYSDEQIGFLREGFRDLTIAELTVAFNARFALRQEETAIKSTIAREKITRERRTLPGRTGQFEKGQKSWNKGVKGYMGANRTSFKKGNAPANRKPLGAERIDKRDGLVLVKVAEQNSYTGFPTRYKHKHVVVWEREHGPVPKGHVVAFIDGDHENCDPANLMCITRSELLRLNQYRYAEQPGDLKPSVLALAKLEVKMFERQC